MRIKIKYFYFENNQFFHFQLEQIDLEIRGIPAPERPVHLTHLEGFKKEYDKLKNDFVSENLFLNLFSNYFNICIEKSKIIHVRCSNKN